MRAIGFLRCRKLELAWGAFAAANLVAMVVWPGWETIPFHFIWISLTILYGFRVWGVAGDGARARRGDPRDRRAHPRRRFKGIQLWGELFEVPLMSAMFLAMVWHARRRQEALRTSSGARRSEPRCSPAGALPARRLARAAHTGHDRPRPPRAAAADDRRARPRSRVALDELQRIERILDRCCCSRRPSSPTSSSRARSRSSRSSKTSSCAGPRWRRACGGSARWRVGTLRADPEALRIALDALLENAVKYTDDGDAIELRAQAAVDRGRRSTSRTAARGIPPDALERIFDRFARADAARTRAHGRRRARTRDRGRDREGSRRQLHRRRERSRCGRGHGVYPQAARLPRGSGRPRQYPNCRPSRLNAPV